VNELRRPLVGLGFMLYTREQPPCGGLVACTTSEITTESLCNKWDYNRKRG